MKIDIYTKPDTLWFGEGDDRFGLQLKRFSAAERMAVFHACAQDDFELIQRAIEPLICGWEQVQEAGGQAIPFIGQDASGQEVCNLGAFLGSIALPLQCKVMAGILAFIGIPADRVAAIADALAQPGEGASAVDPTAPPAGDMPTSASSS